MRILNITAPEDNKSSLNIPVPTVPAKIELAKAPRIRTGGGGSRGKGPPRPPGARFPGEFPDHMPVDPYDRKGDPIRHLSSDLDLRKGNPDFQLPPLTPPLEGGKPQRGFKMLTRYSDRELIQEAARATHIIRILDNTPNLNNRQTSQFKQLIQYLDAVDTEIRKRGIQGMINRKKWRQKPSEDRSEWPPRHGDPSWIDEMPEPKTPREEALDTENFWKGLLAKPLSQWPTVFIEERINELESLRRWLQQRGIFGFVAEAMNMAIQLKDLWDELNRRRP